MIEDRAGHFRLTTLFLLPKVNQSFAPVAIQHNHKKNKVEKTMKIVEKREPRVWFVSMNDIQGIAKAGDTFFDFFVLFFVLFQQQSSSYRKKTT